jgi:hypothetical protein
MRPIDVSGDGVKIPESDRFMEKLIQILFEEFTSNGGHFSSPDAEFWFQQSFGDFGESNAEIFKRLLNFS